MLDCLMPIQSKLYESGLLICNGGHLLSLVFDLKLVNLYATFL